jgi:hypothetical protein
MDIDDDLLFARPIDGGYTWTLSSRVGDMLKIAESLYGSRDLSYTFLGIEFAENKPQNWFPGRCKHVVIQLSKSCIMEPDKACFQLAHEVIHLLSPTEYKNVNVLEEGLASYFQMQYMDKEWPKANMHIDDPAYISAKKSVEKLLALDKDAIKTLRKKEPVISHITESMIIDSYPSLETKITKHLCQKFNAS